MKEVNLKEYIEQLIANRRIEYLNSPDRIIEDYESEVCSFEGELKDGKRFNGKVKEDYYEDSFHYHFDGVYVNGIKKGKEYEEGKLIYEGE